MVSGREYLHIGGVSVRLQRAGADEVALIISNQVLKAIGKKEVTEEERFSLLSE